MASQNHIAILAGHSRTRKMADALAKYRFVGAFEDYGCKSQPRNFHLSNQSPVNEWGLGDVRSIAVNQVVEFRVPEGLIAAGADPCHPAITKDDEPDHPQTALYAPQHVIS